MMDHCLGWILVSNCVWVAIGFHLGHRASQGAGHD